MKAFNPEKELKKIQRGNRNKILYSIILLLLIISIGSTYALYQIRYSKRIIYTKVAPFSNSDLDLAVKVKAEDKNRDEFPSKEEATEKGLVYTEIDCEKEDVTTANWDTESWSLDLNTKGPNKCTVLFNIVKDFSYTGATQKYTVPYTGNYKLEVWGAQGGGNTWYGTGQGPGSYAYGEINLTEGEILYIVIGGAGVSSSGSSHQGGYNGGASSGYGQNGGGGGGGGATHIATVDGILPTLEANKDKIIIVAGGGGSGNAKCQGPYTGDEHNNVFGMGSTGLNGDFGGGGGGGGYYGGIAGGSNPLGSCNNTHGGGRGTSYIAPNVTSSGIETDQQSGDGKAIITYLGE